MTQRLDPEDVKKRWWIGRRKYMRFDKLLQETREPQNLIERGEAEAGWLQAIKAPPCGTYPATRP